jgi:hypothetical protein
MRLFEVDSSYEDDLVLILRNLIGRADGKDQSQQLTYSAINGMLANKGHGPINQQLLTGIYDNSTELPNLIADFDEEIVTLGTQVKDKDQPKEPMDIPGGKSVDQMAKGGVADHMRKISR